MKNEKTIGETLKVFRVQAGMTQTELGEKLCISAQAISKWERDESQPDIETLKKLAEIYGISVAEIIDPDNAVNNESEPAVKTEEPKEASVYDGRYDLYISEEFKEKTYLKTVSYISKKFKIGLAESKKIADNFPYALTGGVTKEEADMLDKYFAEIGVTLKRESAKGRVPNRPMVTEKDIEEKRKLVDANKKYLKKRFIVANITAAIPAIAAIIVLLVTKPAIFENPLLCVYAGICAYATVFLLWYPSITREGMSLVFEFGEEFNGCLTFIPALVLCVLILAVSFAVSPIIYALSLPRRIKRMMAGDMRDDIFV